MDGTEDDWRHVRAAIDERMKQLPLSWTDLYAASVSEGTYRKMSAGIGVARPGNRIKIARALGWTDDSIDRLLSGGAAVVAATASPDEEAALEAMQRTVAALEARVAQLEQREPPPSSGARGSKPGARPAR